MSGNGTETTVDGQVGSPDRVAASCAQEVVELRSAVDNIDAAVIHMLAERFRVTAMIGGLKAGAGFAAADPRRESDQIARLRTLAGECGLDADMAEAYLHLVADAAKRNHIRLAREGG